MEGARLAALEADSASREANAILPVPMAQSWKKCRRVMLGVLGFILGLVKASRQRLQTNWMRSVSQENL